MALMQPLMPKTEAYAKVNVAVPAWTYLHCGSIRPTERGQSPSEG